MTRNAGSHGPTTAASIRRVGLKLIYEHGFNAMSLRQLAAEVGLQPASLYNHIRTKQGLLFGLVHDHMLALLEQSAQALAAAPQGDPVGRLRAFIAHHLLYHMEKKREVYIANFELRSLEPANYRIIVALRRTYEERLIALLEEGVAAGVLDVHDVPVTAYAILAMLTGACTWYKPEGRLSKPEIVALHTDLVLKGCLRTAEAPQGRGPDLSKLTGQPPLRRGNRPTPPAAGHEAPA
ncbi:TetR/AcrR family transcriptional regulator [Rhodovastum atsumiense]|uniref:TetR/AcrR family transcriptional regulator n=1 Tax=Rhodovastum atsumiense TaxID=504468 RepID=A0A5M6IPI2_9PROT|nr:TetR/AcrR family transcriptional regulator [Rhodovastum atsumiense]KAA5610193.1 TetR/AcrR family transcriptional regulator [Rhodovastum atsumiense]CAH2604195.1 TetR/AcrR family transcriptional regulator [Rhodovastum atsumiense]